MKKMSINNSLVIGQIIKLEGECFVKRENQSNYIPISLGHQVYQGDLIKPAPEAITIIKFTNFEIIWRVPSGIESGVINGCPPFQDIIESSCKINRKSSAPQSSPINQHVFMLFRRQG